MDTQAIRKKILDLALRGKLTEQRLEDGTVELLFSELRISKEENERNAGNKKTDIPYAQDEEPPFEIPSTWMWVHMGEVFSHNTGKALNTSVQEGTLLEYITTSNVYWDRFELSALKSMYFTEDEIEKCTIRKGDLLICEGGDIGRSSIWPFNTEMRIQNHIHRLRSYLPSIDVKLYYYVMRYYKMKGLISGRGIGLEGFSSKRLHNLIVPLPPTEEQHRIVAEIDAIFSLLDTIDTLQSQYQNNLATLKSKIIDAGIQGKLTEQLPEDGTAEELYQQIQQEKLALEKAGKTKKSKPLPPISDEEKPFDIPENWKWVRIGNIGSWSAGSTPARNNPAYYKDGSIPWLKTGDLDDNYISEVPEYITELAMKETSVRLNPVGSVLMAMYGATIGKLGILETPMTTNQACCACIPYTGMYNKYLFYYLLGRRKEFIEKGKGGAQPNISKEIIVNSAIPLPPLAEQKRIVAKLEELLPLCEG